MARSSLIPGFRFHPTDVELVMYYLKKKLLGKKIGSNAVAEVNIYDFCPWDLPDKSSLKSGDLEWYFFCPKSKKYSSGGRSNRGTATGFWKATGRDRKIKYNERTVATIKTLIFHLGPTGKGQRTDWVMHEYRMEDEQLANAGIVQDAYVLCRIYEKSGPGPKNGAQYGAEFNEEELDEVLASCPDSQAIVGLVGASNATGHKQKSPAATSMTGPGSSVVTFSGNETTNKLTCKQKGPATMDMTEPGSSMVTSSANEPTNTLNYKQKGPATTNLTEPGSSMVTFPANEPTNTPSCKQKGPATMDMTEPGSSLVRFPANEPTNTPTCKQKGPTTTNLTEPGSSITHGLSVTEPGSTSVTLFPNDDVMTIEDIDLIMGEAANGEGVKTMAPNEDDGFYDDLKNLINLDDLNTDGLQFTYDEFLTPGDLDLENFFMD